MKGKFILFQNRDEIEICEIEDMIGTDKVLLKIHPKEGPTFSEIVPIDEITAGLVFDTRAQLDEFVSWRKPKEEDKPSLKLVSNKMINRMRDRLE